MKLRKEHLIGISLFMVMEGKGGCWHYHYYSHGSIFHLLAFKYVSGNLLHERDISYAHVHKHPIVAAVVEVLILKIYSSFCYMIFFC